jgi:hypothetical protein
MPIQGLDNHNRRWNKKAEEKKDFHRRVGGMMVGRNENGKETTRTISSSNIIIKLCEGEEIFLPKIDIILIKLSTS